MFFIFLLFLATIEPGAGKKPNIIFIISDDQGYHDIGYHGAEIKTPTLDGLAKNGVTLENYYVQPICTPSRSQLLTGRYQIHTGMQSGVLLPVSLGGLPLNYTTLPDQLRTAGYTTHMIGKWHLGYHQKEYIPTYRGFDTFYGLYNGGGDHFDHSIAFIDTGYDLHFDKGEDLQVLWNNTEYSTKIFGDRAVQIIEEHEQSKPLFLYLSFQAVHSPIQAPQEYIDMYKDIEDVDRRMMAAMTTCIDDAVRNVTDALQNKGMWNDSIIIYTSDNGGESDYKASNFPLRGEKRGMFEGGVRSIGFVAGPLVPSGVINRELMHISDWYPTLVTLAGGDVDDPDLELDGYDVWDSIVSDEVSPRKELLHNINPRATLLGQNTYPNVFDVRVQSAIRVGDYKLVTGYQDSKKHNPNPSNPDEDPCANYPHHRQKRQLPGQNVYLYNIKEDPSECDDLSQKRPDKVMELLQRLQFYNSTAVPVVVPPLDLRHLAAHTGGAWVPWVE